MADLATELQPFAESMIAPGETLLGACVASQQARLKGWMVAVAVTEDRLILRRLKRSKVFEADGSPLALTPGDIASAKAGAGGGFGASPTAEIMDRASAQLKLRTTSGEKLKLMMMSGEGGIFANLGGGEIQRQGVQAIGEWFERHAQG